MIAARKDCRKMKTTMTTRMIASMKVSCTASIEAATNSVGL